MAQGSWQVPTGGSESAITFAGQCNTAWLAVASHNSGASAPANGPSSAPVQYQMWMDLTNASFPSLRIYDGTNWDRIGSLDIAGSTWLPQIGGGLGSITAAATTDIGSVLQGQVTINGTTTITSLGSSAKTGEMKLVFMGGQLTITNSANLVCPGGASIITVAGDTFWAVYQGAGKWIIVNYQKTTAAPGLPTGLQFYSYNTGALPGFVRANGLTIGNTGSGATEAIGPQCQALYLQIWTVSASIGDAEIIISGGRGATAAADWAALKTITTPDMRGRVSAGLDGMGNSAAGRLTATTITPNATAIGSVGGAQTFTIAGGNLPSHTHTWGTALGSASGSGTTGAGSSHTHSVAFTALIDTTAGVGGGSARLGTSNAFNFSTGAEALHTHPFSFSSGNVTVSGTTDGGPGASVPSPIVQPTKVLTCYIAL